MKINKKSSKENTVLKPIWLILYASTKSLNDAVMYEFRVSLS